jgi:hypothetical protein
MLEVRAQRHLVAAGAMRAVGAGDGVAGPGGHGAPSVRVMFHSQEAVFQLDLNVAKPLFPFDAVQLGFLVERLAAQFIKRSMFTCLNKQVINQHAGARWAVPMVLTVVPLLHQPAPQKAVHRSAKAVRCNRVVAADCG